MLEALIVVVALERVDPASPHARTWVLLSGGGEGKREQADYEERGG